MYHKNVSRRPDSNLIQRAKVLTTELSIKQVGPICFKMWPGVNWFTWNAVIFHTFIYFPSFIIKGFLKRPNHLKRSQQLTRKQQLISFETPFFLVALCLNCVSHCSWCDYNFPNLNRLRYKAVALISFIS